MSYYVVVLATEARAGLKPLDRFWLAVRHSAKGRVPYARYQQAGIRRAREGARSGDIERWLSEWAAIDLNPTVQIARTSNSPRAVMEGYNAFNRRVCVGVETTMEASAAGYAFRRQMRSSRVDPEFCKLTTLAAMEKMMGQVAARRGGGLGQTLAASQAANILGVERSASGELASFFETGGPASVEEAALAIGCSRRTLQRAVKQEGGTVEELKICARLLRAHRLMAGDASLTDIAAEAGYSDSAHMSRAFMTSCGLTPSEVRKASYPGPRAAPANSNASARPSCH
jgi:AraC-like DNA-binding protein